MYFKKALKRSLYTFLDILLPNHCEVCGRFIITKENRPKTLCIYCIQNMPYIHKDNYIRCEKCGRVKDSCDGYCVCESETLSFDTVKSLCYYYDPIIELIHKMKFQNRHSICSDFGFMLSYYYKDYISEFDNIVYVPLGRKRFKERGYNQSLNISKVISKKLNIPIAYDIVFRKKETLALSTITDSCKRKEIIKNAFDVNKKSSVDFSNKNILIIDDVFTTGSTINELANTIKNYWNVRKIGVLTLSRTS